MEKTDTSCSERGSGGMGELLARKGASVGARKAYQYVTNTSKILVQLRQRPHPHEFVMYYDA